jgi:hypothetical protein
MRVFFDTEFIDDGNTVELVSIGLVRADGQEYYAEIAECDRSRGCEWVQKNVVAHLTGPVKPRAQIAEEIKEFCGRQPEFWAYYAAYDWLCLCQLFGRMLDVPEDWPNFVNDLQSIRYLRGIHYQPPQLTTHHHALNDARWNREFFGVIAREIGHD